MKRAVVARPDRRARPRRRSGSPRWRVLGGSERPDAGRPALRRRPRTPEPGATDPPEPGAGAASTPSSCAGSRAATGRCARRSRCRSTTRTPAARPSSSRCSRSRRADPGRRIGSLVVNPGGPGAPGTDYAAYAASPASSGAPLLDAYDIVGFDPRGTGTSARSTASPTTSSTPTSRRTPTRTPPAEVDDLRGLRRRARPRLRRSAPASWPPTSPRSRRPATWTCCAPRSASPTLTYFGASYGTKLGATYADLFPDRVGRLVLDGAVDLSLELARAQPRAGRRLRDRAARLRRRTASTSGDCFLGDTLDAGLARIKQFLDDVDAQPLPTDGRPRARRRQRLLRHRAPALQPRLLAGADPGPAGRRSTVTASLLLRLLRPLLLARRRRLHRQQRRGVLRDQLPRRPVGDPGRRGAGQPAGLREGVADLRLASSPGG